MVHREELRIGLVKDKARVKNIIRELSPACESLRRRESSNVIVLLKYSAVGEGRNQNARMNLTEVRAIDLQSNVHLDIEEWISRNSLDEV